MKQQNNGRAEFGQTSTDERISEWLDDESANPNAYKELLEADEGRKVYESYQAIGAALRQETCAHWQAGFSERVALAIDDEPAILAPSAMSSTKRTLTGWAVAASVAVAFVIGIQTIPFDNQQALSGSVAGDSLKADASSRFAPSATDNMVAEYHVAEQEKAEIDRINTIFAEFEKRNTPNNNAAVPYVRVVSGEQVRTFRMTPQQFRRVMMELEMRNQEANKRAEQERRKSNP